MLILLLKYIYFFCYKIFIKRDKIFDWGAKKLINFSFLISEKTYPNAWYIITIIKGM